MGTRGLLGHIIRGNKKAAYNHWVSFHRARQTSSYDHCKKTNLCILCSLGQLPEGLGADIARFISSLTPEQLEEMKKMIDQLEW